MATKTNTIFLGCNYSNKKVKRHFEVLKSQWESEWPVRVILIDKEESKGARDLWAEIRNHIEVYYLAILDVSAFRPNVVLELGYALAVKDQEAILVSFDARKLGGRQPQWLLSDIPHLHRHAYKTLEQLDQKLSENLEKVPAIDRFKELSAAAEQETDAPDKYVSAALSVLHALRKGSLSGEQLRRIPQGSAIRVDTLTRLLKEHKLARRSRGRNGRWSLVED
jgi:hypothetical protein